MTSAQDRLAGWRSALIKRGLPVDAFAHGDFTTRGGLAATERLLAKHPDLDAIFVASDLMAVGALAVLKARGWRFRRMSHWSAMTTPRSRPRPTHR